ncbi:hypothetical protein FALCPG4_000748 [Fusarium falciforme]
MKERSSAVAAEFMSPMASIPKGRPIRQDGQHSELGSAIIVIKIPAAWFCTGNTRIVTEGHRERDGRQPGDERTRRNLTHKTCPTEFWDRGRKTHRTPWERIPDLPTCTLRQGQFSQHSNISADHE